MRVILGEETLVYSVPVNQYTKKWGVYSIPRLWRDISGTLEAYRKDGISDANSKYFNTCSYSNVFIEKLSENSMLVLYNNAKYDPGDGLHHKAAFVRTVTFTEEA